MNTVTALDGALERILAHEGGWSNHPADRGGKTMYGVTEGVFLDARARNVVPGLPSEVRQLTKAQARLIYERMYWIPSGCDLLPWPLCYAQMDAAVQHGAPRAVKWIQRATGDLKPDGVLGPISRKRLERSTDWLLVMARVLAHRAELYIRILRTPSQTVFASGWANRFADVVGVCLYTYAPAELMRVPVSATLRYQGAIGAVPALKVERSGRR